MDKFGIFHANQTSIMLQSALELRVGLNLFGPSSESFADRSRVVLLLWIVFVIYASCLFLLCCLVCSLGPCGLLFLACGRLLGGGGGGGEGRGREVAS